jgi:hypothetical protein
MKKLPVIIAAAGVMCAFPALAAPPETGSQYPLGMGEHKSYGYEREGEMHRYGGERGEALREGCKYITVRQRRGDEIVVRHFKRCD